MAIRVDSVVVPLSVVAVLFGAQACGPTGSTVDESVSTRGQKISLGLLATIPADSTFSAPGTAAITTSTATGMRRAASSITKRGTDGVSFTMAATMGASTSTGFPSFNGHL